MITDWQRYAEKHPRAVDTTVALVLFAASLLGNLLSGPGDPSGEGILQPGRAEPAVLLAGVACLALLWHRSHPRTVVALTAACAVTASALGYLLTPLLLAPAMTALYWLARYTDRRTARACCFAFIVLLIPTTLVVGPHDRPLLLKTVGPAFWVLMPVAYGTAVRLRRAHREAVQARAEHAERTREEEARHRVAEERMRIARELHDVVAHHMALANALAGTAAHLARTHPEQTQRILNELVGTTSSALRELKATVGLLRQADDPDAPLEPSPGLGRLSELTAAFASAGLTVPVTVEGEEQLPSPGVDLTAFRIVQEALTNVTKHAAAKTAHITLAYSHDRLTITVSDDGGTAVPTTAVLAAPAPRSGFGLIGMRERARSVGGRLQTGHRPEGGFKVTAELPLHPQNPEEVRNR